MRKNFTGMFMLVSVLMQLLHILRGAELCFIIGGPFPYVLYYGTMVLYVVCLIRYLFSSVKRLKAQSRQH